jgi:hypothetical protein
VRIRLGDHDITGGRRQGLLFCTVLYFVYVIVEKVGSIDASCVFLRITLIVSGPVVSSRESLLHEMSDHHRENDGAVLLTNPFHTNGASKKEMRYLPSCRNLAVTRKWRYVVL